MLSRVLAESWSRIVAHAALWALVLVAAANLSKGNFASCGGWAGLLMGLALSLVFELLRVSLLRRQPDVRPWTEDVRLVSLVVLAAWLFRPFLTPDFFGGNDAHWYGYTMIDVLQQARAGVFPVWVNQGEYMFHGALHPIRTAPYHHYLGIFLDGLTARSLSPLAIQHLTVLVTAVQGGLACYLSLVWFAPERRWSAWLMAALYLTAPAVSAYIYGQEMYMTFMAFAWLPVVLAGNLRLFRDDGLPAWTGLAAGLALTWLCHAPVAAWLTLGTLGLQGLRLLTEDFSFKSWRRALGGAGLLGGLMAYTLWSVAELSPEGAARGKFPVALLLLALGVAALIRFLCTGRRTWGLLAGALAAGLGLLAPSAGRWLLAAWVISLILMAMTARRPEWRARLFRPGGIALLLLAGGVIGLALAPLAPANPALAWVNRLCPDNLRPLAQNTQMLRALQVGYALWGAMALGLSAVLVAPTRENRMLGLFGLAWLPLVLPVPGVSRFLLDQVPPQVSGISSDIAYLRYLPTMIGLAAFLGFFGLQAWALRRPRLGAGGFILLCAGLAWSLAEAEKFVRWRQRGINTPETVAAYYRTDQIREFSFVIPGLPLSSYMISGVRDYHLESRLLRRDNPARELGESLPWDQARRFTFTSRPDELGPLWLHLAPALTLAPGEHLALRFEFFDRTYSGTLIFQGPHGFYREYLLPSAGFFSKSFGVDPEKPKVIALWNDTAEPQPVEALFLQSALPADGRPFGDFARVAVQAYDPARLPVRTLDLIPSYRATVRAAAPAYLETVRTFIPGYRATVNGQEVPVVPSPNHNAMVPVPAGESAVEVRYAGTRALWAALLVTVATWLGVIVSLVRRSCRARSVQSP